MKILHDNLWFCVDCTILECNGDASGMSDDQEARCLRGMRRLTSRFGTYLAANFDLELGEGHEEVSARGCDCCGSRLAGEFHRFALLTKE